MRRLATAFSLLIGSVALGFLPRATEQWERVVLAGLAGGLLVGGGYLSGRGIPEKR